MLVAAISIVAALFALSLGLVALMIIRERRGNPLFKKFDDVVVTTTSPRTAEADAAEMKADKI